MSILAMHTWVVGGLLFAGVLSGADWWGAHFGHPDHHKSQMPSDEDGGDADDVPTVGIEVVNNSRRSIQGFEIER